MDRHESRPHYETLVNRIASGELTRLQAAKISQELTGLSTQTFLSWLRSADKLKDLKHTRGNAGPNSPNSHTDPEKIAAYDHALRLALTGKVSARTAASMHKVSYQYLLRKMKAAKHIQRAENESPGSGYSVHDMSPTKAELAEEKAAHAGGCDLDLVKSVLDDPRMVTALAAVIRASRLVMNP
jgi:hypothetical protein